MQDQTTTSEGNVPKFRSCSVFWRCVLTAFLIAVSSLTVLAQKPSKADFSKEAYTIERLSTRITADSNGSSAREVTAEIQILADAGVKAFAVLTFTYTSANETVEIEYVRVRKADGSVVKTPDYNIQDMPAEVTRTAPLYSDIHEKHVAVKGLSVGDVLEYLIRYRIVKPEVPGQFWYEYSFVKNAVAKEERLEINIPTGKYLKVVSPDFRPDIKEEGTRRVYRWTHSNLAVKEVDPNEPPRRIPPNPDVQITTFASWEEVGGWYRGLQKEPLRVTPAIQAKAAELTKGLATDEEKIHAIYAFVSLKYHYVGLDFGIGRYQPHAADDVLDNGYGDCKDKHTLLASLLQAAGIEAWPVLIHTQRRFDADVPSPGQFNHVITVVPRGDKFLWLDTTPEVSPYGLILINLRNKQALAIPATKPPMLMTTPENPPFPSEQEFSMEGKLAADGTFTGHARQFYRGDSEVVMRELFRRVAESQWKEVAQRLSYGLNFGGEVSNVKMTPPDDLDKPFELSYDYVRKKFGDWENRQITAPLPPLGIESTQYSTEKKPPDPVLLGGVGKITYHSRLELPTGYMATAPAKAHLTESYAEYTDDTRIEKGVMTTTRELLIKKSEVPLAEWDGYRKFGQAVWDDEFNFIPLHRIEASIEDKTDPSKQDDHAGEQDVDSLVAQAKDAMARQDGKRAQELLEKVIAKDPTYRTAHLFLGITMMAQTRMPEALAAFQKEEDISPNDPRAFQMAAGVANLSGNRDQAIAELRKLRKIDPDSVMTAEALESFLLEQKKYPEVVELLETALTASPDNRSLHYELGMAYFDVGQKEKAVSHLQKVAEQDDAQPWVLNNIAFELAENDISVELARQYAEKALKQVEERSLQAIDSADTGARVTRQLSMIWDTVGWVYFRNGDANRAESFVRSAWLLGQEAAVGKHLGEIYQKEGKTKAAESVYELALASAEASPGMAHARKIFGIPSPPFFDTSERDELIQELTARYKKLTGKTPALRETRRLPNGEWTKTGSERLIQMRTVPLGKRTDASGDAVFNVVFTPKEIESVNYVSGEKSLASLSEKIKSAPFQVEFPVGSQAKILRRAEASCSSSSGCTVTLRGISAAENNQPPGNVWDNPGPRTPDPASR